MPALVLSLTTLNANTPPPPDYYAANLRGVVAHLSQHQAELLGVSAARDLTRIMGLTEQPLRLLARLITRSTPVVRVDSLNYDEIADTQTALAELVKQALVEVNPPVATDLLLARLRVAEIRLAFPSRQARCKTKQALLEMVVDHYGEDQVQAIIGARISWVHLRCRDSLQRMLIAYFGSARGDFSDFVIRDLGLVKFEGYPIDANCRVFATAADMQRYLDLRALVRLPHHQRLAALPWLRGFLCQTSSTTSAPSLANPDLQRRWDRLLIAWGRDFERGSDDDTALQCYGLAEAHPARERQVRILQKRVKSSKSSKARRPIEPTEAHSPIAPSDPAVAAQQLLQNMVVQPHCLTEALFARKQIAPGEKTAGTGVPWPETVWRVAKGSYPRVEQRVLEALVSNGGVGWHVENALFTTLLGLAFWECLFAPIPGMFSHPFQSGPRDLFWPDFRARRKDLFKQRFDELSKPGALWRQIRRIVTDRFGVSCSLVNWSVASPSVLAAVQRSMRPEQLLQIFDYMLRDLQQTRTGLPDLFLSYAPGRFELVEVKGPGDQLQPNQRVWLAALVDMQIPCRVVSLRSAG